MHDGKIKWEFYGKNNIIIGNSIFTLEELQEKHETKVKELKEKIENQQKEIEELEVYKKWAEEKIATGLANIEIEKLNKEIKGLRDNDYIPKSKIKEKIRLYKAVDNHVSARAFELLLEEK